jgi:hypothetical protein
MIEIIILGLFSERFSAGPSNDKQPEPTITTGNDMFVESK